MARLATALGTDPMALTATALLEGQSAAATDAGLAELDRIQDCAGRFPGWAALLAETHRRAEGLFFHAGKVLNDRLGHDPQLSASLREMLTAGTPVRSTAGVLAESDDIAPEWRAKFHANLQEDSERLAAGAEALVAFLDGAAMGLCRSLTVVPPRRKWNRRFGRRQVLALAGQAFAEPHFPQGFGGPVLTRASMLIFADDAARLTASRVVGTFCPLIGPDRPLRWRRSEEACQGR